MGQIHEDPGDPDLPQISEVTELHTYYYMEDVCLLNVYYLVLE